ncbi:hypothetical protein ABZ802_31495 [Streptomyces sp. NPDC047737]|uniref:hypothetical protein n=1 Tax=Streptomyces sp. NPDC047737 TaxID=3155740 RepID=UPI0033CD5722
MTDADVRATIREGVYNELLVLAAKLDQSRRQGGKAIQPHDTAAMHAVRLAACLLYPLVEAPAPPFPPKRTDHLVKLVNEWHDVALFPERPATVETRPDSEWPADPSDTDISDCTRCGTRFYGAGLCDECKAS